MMSNGDSDDGRGSDHPATVVPFPGPEPVSDEERAKRLCAEVERLARLSPGEYLLYLDDTAKKHGVDKAALREMVEINIQEIEKKRREQQVEQRRIEQRVDKKRTAEEREHERKQDRAERDARRAEKEAEKAATKKEKERLAALGVILKLPRSEHAIRLQQLARRLGDPLDTLQAEFDQLLADEAAVAEREASEPWPEPVNTKELLDDVSVQLRRYVVIHDEAAATVYAVTALFAWMHDEIATFSPILVVQGADTEVAKSLLCKIHSLLTPRARMIVKPTGPSIYRLVDYAHPTLYIDNGDKLLAQDHSLADVINSSWIRGIPIPRVVDKKVYDFDPFCFKVINGIDLLPHMDPATRTRCIVTEMLPKLPGEKVTHLKHAASDERFSILRRKAMRWAADNMVAIKDATPAIPEGFLNRLEENYVLLFAIVDLAGGDWPKKMRAAAVKLSREFNLPSLGRRLLAVFFDLFCTHGRFLTSALVEAALPSFGDEWANYRDTGRPINKWQVTALLRPFKIKADLIHPRGGKTTDRGYDATWPSIVTAFKHYLGKSLPSTHKKK
jgi:hypothetical protein